MGRHNPIAREVLANGLSHHVLEWAPASDPLQNTGNSSFPVAVLLHGFMDAASTWDFVAPQLAAANMRVIAPDLRGFGNAPRAPAGSYYHFPEYVADVADLVDALAPTSPLHVVGHSMGGTVAALYAGTFPERVRRLALLEGLGPPDNAPEVAPDRMRRWIEDQRRLRNERARSMSPSEAERRLVERHGNVAPAIVASRIVHLAQAAEDGRVRWKFDALHRSTSPFPFFAAMYEAFAARVTAPVLVVGGGPEGFHPPDEEHRIAAFRDARVVELAGAGHMMHWSKPDELVARLLAFFASDA